MVYALGPRVKAANALSGVEFIHKHIKGEYPITGIDGHVVTLETSSSMSPDHFEQCLNLLESTSRAAYEKSNSGWSTKKKIREMREPDMRYLLVTLAPKEVSDNSKPTDESSQTTRNQRDILQGFLSFMLTMEDEMEVAYIYEVHVQDWARSSGIGSKLMNILADIGRVVGVEKAMLTVFTSNEPAMRLYSRLGYVWYDEEPVAPPKRLRGRIASQPKPSYLILARDLNSAMPK